MKKNDFIFIGCCILFFLPFFVIPQITNLYKSFNSNHGILMSFIKFAILATLGESIGLRIRKGKYNEKGFGLLPKALVWGFLGVFIKFAFITFSTGVPNFLKYIGVTISDSILSENFTVTKLLTSFSISVSMNCIFAPIMMTLHKISDLHIARTGGTLKRFFTSVQFGEMFVNLKWDVMWYFVFKKTIPLFWIPAHTITFLLPSEYRILFAAVLGIVLGVILSIADVRS